MRIIFFVFVILKLEERKGEKEEIMMNRRIVVTGIGILSPLGIGTESSWLACMEGRSGIHKLTKFDPTGHLTQIAGQVDEFNRTA